MTELLRFDTAEGGHIVVEVGSQEPGIQRAARSGGIIDVRHRFEDALGDVADAAAKSLAVFRDGALRPDQVEIEFGVRLNAEAGAVIAKTAVEGHLVVKLTWTPQARTAPPAGDPGIGEGAGGDAGGDDRAGGDGGGGYGGAMVPP